VLLACVVRHRRGDDASSVLGSSTTPPSEPHALGSSARSLSTSIGMLEHSWTSSSQWSNTGPRAEPEGIEFADCMRAHGVPSFPDSNAGGGGFQFSPRSGFNPQAPAARSAQTACRKLLPGGGPGPGPASESQKLALLRLVECVRSHGVPDFPDPTTNTPWGPPRAAASRSATQGVSLGAEDPDAVAGVQAGGGRMRLPRSVMSGRCEVHTRHVSRDRGRGHGIRVWTSITAARRNRPCASAHRLSHGTS
jgi:hypothetical protein